MERPHLMDGGHGYYLPYHAGEEHIGVNKSPPGYKELRKQNFLTIPSERTLKNITNKVDEIYSAKRTEYSDAKGQIFGVTDDGEVAQTLLGFMISSIAGPYRDMKIFDFPNFNSNDHTPVHFAKFQDLHDLEATKPIKLAHSLTNKALNPKWQSSSKKCLSKETFWQCITCAEHSQLEQQEIDKFVCHLNNEGFVDTDLGDRNALFYIAGALVRSIIRNNGCTSCRDILCNGRVKQNVAWQCAVKAELQCDVGLLRYTSQTTYGSISTVLKKI
ncbi:hypothetical protein GQR58_012120 [Nymphon striatum]|nr:hypothetical protein GQR58_012120 [Nymphon striatum]